MSLLKAFGFPRGGRISISWVMRVMKGRTGTSMVQDPPSTLN